MNLKASVPVAAASARHRMKRVRCIIIDSLDYFDLGGMQLVLVWIGRGETNANYGTER